ncbi:MAG: hypothetical protein ACLPJH_19520 [Myxococcaceae bacterium]
MKLHRDEWLLVRTLDDVQARFASKDEYDLLLCALLLRKLLVDRKPRPLVEVVNDRYTLCLTFDICEPDLSQVQSEAWDLLEGLDPEKNRGLRRTSVSMAQLLATVVMRIQHQNFTVKKLIQQAANVDGGVHLELEPTDERKRALRLASEWLRVRGVASTLHHITVLSPIVLRGLEPLRRVVLASAGARDG